MTAATTITTTTPSVPTGAIDSDSCNGTEWYLTAGGGSGNGTCSATGTTPSIAFPLCPLSNGSGGGGSGNGSGDGLTLFLPAITTWTTLSTRPFQPVMATVM